jgi:hypothetical protein
MIAQRWMLVAGLCMGIGLAIALGGKADAATEDGAFAIRGIGGDNCRDFLQRLQSDERNQGIALSWLLGYSTAINRVEPDTFDVSPLTDPFAILRLVASMCQRAPGALVDTIAYGVLSSLATARVTTNSPLVETRSGENVANVRSETLMRMQEVLIRLGHLGGTPDGDFGPQTETAMRAFQEQQGLDVTGVADTATIFRLLIELPAQEAQ